MDHDIHPHDHSTMDHSMHQEETTAKDYFIFAGIIIGILIISLIYENIKSSFNSLDFMKVFMGVFFLVFGVFKLLDLKGFAVSYMGYDIIARKFTWYAYIYPFLELLLALGYFLNIKNVNYATVILMAIGSIGVAKELLRGSKIKCACLGTYVKLPLTTVSLIEDVTMGIMALALILYK